MVVILKINVNKGDRVRVREWEQMRLDLRTYSDGSEKLIEKQPEGAREYSFDEYMEKYCGRTATVKRVNGIGEIFLVFDGSTKEEEFRFREWMIEREA